MLYELVISFFGIGILTFLCYLLSTDKSLINYKSLLKIFIFLIAVASVLLNTSIGNILMGAISDGFTILMSFANDGVSFVFGGLQNNGEFCFFLGVLLPIIFISILIGFLRWTGALKQVISGVGWLVSKVTDYPRLESFNAVSSLILGQSENWIAIKDQLNFVPKTRLYTLSASAMSTISLVILGSYMKLIEPRYVVTAVILNMFGAFYVLNLLNPISEKDREPLIFDLSSKRENFFVMLTEYIVTGFKVAVMVGIMLIGFLAIISMINYICLHLLGISFQQILGYIFAPIAYLMGITSWHDAVIAGGLMATKLVSNEFVAMTILKQGITDGSIMLRPQDYGILATFLVSFANFSSIGIIIGCVKALNEEKSLEVSSFGLRLLLGATMVSFLSASIVGIVTLF